MGTFNVGCLIKNHVNRGKAVEIPRLMVDTGSEATWIPRKLLERIEVQPEKRQTFQTANGQWVYRDIGYAVVRVGQRETVDEAVFAEKGEYAKRMQWFKLHLELLHQALNHFSRDKAALKTFVTDQEKKYSSGLDSYVKTEGDRQRDVLDDMFVRAYGNNLARQVQAHVEFAENKLCQTEIILRCAFFEAEMKDIHRHCPCAKPTLLRGDKEIALGRLVAKGEDAILEEEIAAEVEKLDRQNAKERAKYFKDKLGLKWGAPKLCHECYHFKADQVPKHIVTGIDKYSNLRNKIVPEDTDYVVKQDELSGSRNYFTFVPASVVSKP